MRSIVLVPLLLSVGCKDRPPTPPQSQSTMPAGSQVIAPVPALIDRPIGELIDSLRYLRGNFRTGLAIGDFNGQTWLPSAILAKGDSAVSPLLECMSRRESTEATWEGTALSLGAVCYAMLRNLIIYEPPDPDGRWAGFITQPPITDSSLAAAQAAWRIVIQRRLYGLS